MLSLLLIVLACRKQDDYKKYLGNGEIRYTGKADSLQVHPGRNRVQLTWLLFADPKINRAIVYWDNRKDSMIVNIKRGEGIDTIRCFVNNLEERNYTFEVYNFDVDNNISVRTEASGFVFGSLYEDALLSRAITGSDFKGADAEISLADIDTTGGIVAMQIKYTTTDNNLHDTVIKSIGKDQKIILPDYLPLTPYQCRTLYLPDTLAVDTFHTVFETNYIKYDVTSQYIRNPGNPFELDNSKPFGGRFGQLKDWQYNAEAEKNGTYDNIDGQGRMTLWIWGNGPINNGKIYQTFTLPAGSYRFGADISNIDGTLENTWLTIAAGKQLPNIENINTALNAGRIVNKNTTSINATFTLETDTEVTAGLVGTFSNPTEQTIRIKRVFLIREK
ncbi:DUF4998 domain-containing protein [Chitinophaga silvatica]|uniref:DUF4998 domain-containing protein n=1 Tax=Chitinophaga silvatica TaxID=2282649 RepID=UPI00131461B0|nr:DUF4998 domain-containing protein [Chitinophaga silvatica]